MTVTPVPRNSWPIARPNDNQQRDILRKCLRNARESVLNAGTCLGGKHNIPPPYSVEELGACFVVIDSAGQKLAYVYFEEEPGSFNTTAMSRRRSSVAV